MPHIKRKDRWSPSGLPLALLALGALALAFCSSGTAGEPAGLYVSPAGRDTNPGTLQRPFATLARAQAEVRKRLRARPGAPVTVWLRGGRYELAAPLTFGPEDSGSARQPVTYAAYRDETPVVSGGRRITGWRRAGAGRWTAPLPRVEAGRWFFRQLFVDGKRARRARWPRGDGLVTLRSVSPEARTLELDTPLPVGSLGGQDAELVVLQNWSVSRALIQSSEEQRVTTATPVGWIGHDATTAGPGKSAFLEHSLAFVDEPGEWYLDRKTGVLTYQASPGEDPNRRVFVAPALEHLVLLRGGRDRPVRHLRFRGIAFEHAEFPLPAFGYSEIQAGHYGPSVKEPTHVQPAAIEAVYAQDCRFERCRLAHTGGAGIAFGPGCRSNEVRGCEVTDIGGNGVMVGWRGVGVLQSGNEGTLDADWQDPSDAPAGQRITNCHLHDCGAVSFGSVAVFVAFSRDTRVDHNLIHNLPYTGVSVGYRWNTTPTSQRRCVVESNHIHDVMKLLADGGGIYTLGWQPGTVLRGNLIHDVHRSRSAFGGAPNNGFFVDEGSKGFLFEGNTTYNTSGEPVRFNQCQREWHTWRDNHFGVKPGETGYPAGIEDRAGLEAPYRALLTSGRP